MSDCDTIETLSGKPRLLPAKHDILYSKARFVLNQRYIKRPWFNLNPFLEKTDETIDLENFIPEESKYIQRLESLVLCETFTSELPVDTREIAIGEFFTYLYSGAWNHGCSIRVLEGQLLDELLLGLYRLERQGAAVRHTTHAIARNNRLRTGIYKHSVKKEHGSIAETLLLEFAYFGQLSKDRPNPKTIDPFEYLHKSAVVEREPVDEEPAAEMPSSTAVQPKLTAIPKMRNRALSLASPERIRTVNLSAPVEETTKSFWGTKGSLMSKPLQAITVVNSFKSSRQSAPEKDPTIAHGKRQSIALAPSAFPQLSFEKCNHDKRQSISAPQSAFQQLSFAKYNHEKRHSVATASIGFDKRMSFQSPISGLGSIIDNRKDPSVDRVKKKASSPDFDEDDEDCYVEKDVDDLLTPTEQADRDNFFGEELYLSDKRLHGDKQTKNMDTKQILRLKKKELKARRLEAKEAIKRESTRCKPVTLPPMPPRDPIHTPSLSNLKHETIKLPEKMPTLEEFIELLKDDEYYDPRYRNKMRLKGRKIAQRYYIAKGMHRTSVLFSLANMPDEIKNIGLRKYSRTGPDIFTRTHHHSKTNIARLPKLEESESGHCLASQSMTVTSEHPVPRVSRSRGALEVLGVTDSVPCKDFYREFRETPETHEIKGSSEKMKGCGSKLRTGPSSATSLISSSPHRLKNQPEDKLNSPVKFPKIAITTDECEDEADGPSEEEEEEIEEEYAFNTRKLKLSYSVERLRKRRKSKKPKKQAFIEILAKYYKLHNALRLFRKGSATGEVKRAKIRAKKIGQTEEEKKNEAEMVIGRLRQFDFNIDTDASRPHRKLNLDNVSRADFSRPDLQDFHVQLKRALGDFVVRREIVVSDLQTFYKATTSVTFSKPSCFKENNTN